MAHAPGGSMATDRRTCSQSSREVGPTPPTVRAGSRREAAAGRAASLGDERPSAAGRGESESGEGLFMDQMVIEHMFD